MRYGNFQMDYLYVSRLERMWKCLSTKKLIQIFRCIYTLKILSRIRKRQVGGKDLLNLFLANMELLNDFSVSVAKALNEIDPKWREYNGLVICGTHSPHDVEHMIERIKTAREEETPFLGICFGHQLAAVEYARNVLGIKNATSEEFGKEGANIVYKLPQLKVGWYNGESYWNNFEVVPAILEIWDKPEQFITCQYHPEYQSHKNNPHPLLVKFLDICKNQTK